MDPETQAMVMELVDMEMRKFYNALAIKLCNSANLSDHIEDAKQIARITLWKCIESWNPEINEDFGKASYLRVRGAIIDFFRTFNGINRYDKTLRLHFSLDAPIQNAEDLSVKDQLIDGKELIEHLLCREQIPADWESHLDDRTVLMLRLYYWDELPMREIATLLSVNESRVSQLVREGLDYLNEVYGIKNNSSSDRSRKSRRFGSSSKNHNRSTSCAKSKWSTKISTIGTRGKITHYHWHTRTELINVLQEENNDTREWGEFTGSSEKMFSAGTAVN